jgi:hypothetical protein
MNNPVRLNEQSEINIISARYIKLTDQIEFLENIILFADWMYLYFLYVWEVEAQADAKSIHSLTAYGEQNLTWEQYRCSKENK